MRNKTTNKLVGWVLLIVASIYLLNFGFGFIEFIPDNLPIIGNIDEGIAGGLFLQGIRLIK